MLPKKMDPKEGFAQGHIDGHFFFFGTIATRSKRTKKKDYYKEQKEGMKNVLKGQRDGSVCKGDCHESLVT